MTSQSTRTADELTTAIRSVVDRALESSVRDQVAARGRELAANIAVTAGTMADRASEAATEAWRETTPQRAEALRNAERLQRDALRWGRSTWASRLRPAMQRAINGGTLRLAAAGASVPISQELAERARQRLRAQRREERRWRSFFTGLVVGVVVGALAAILTAPRPGSEVRNRLATRAREGAGDWAPLFQRPIDAAGAIVRGNGQDGAPEAGDTPAPDQANPAPEEQPEES